MLAGTVIQHEAVEESALHPVLEEGSLITFVKDRPGHDRRYAIDSSKIETDLAWSPKENFKTGIRKTIQWYLENPEWVESVKTGEYRKWIKRQYGLT